MEMRDHLNTHFELFCKITRLHTTIDGMVELSKLKEMSQSSFLKPITGPQTNLDSSFNFMSILNLNNTNITNINPNANSIDKNTNNDFYLQIVDESKKRTIKFPFYSIVNKFNPKLTDIENFEINPPTLLSYGMRIRLGRVSYDLLLFHNEQSNQTNKFENVMSERNISNKDSVKNHEECIVASVTSEDICRICLCQSSPEMPLISLCKCKGSVQFYHLSCIRQWVQTKRHQFHLKKSSSFHWRKLKCESCLSDFPIFIKFNGTIEPLVNIDLPIKKNFFMLKSVVEDKNHFISLHLCFTDNLNETFVLGRSLEADIRIGDFSLSTSHALIKLDNNKLYLYDNDSKFGTYSEVIEKAKLDTQRENKFLFEKNLMQIQLTNSTQRLCLLQDEIKRNNFKSYLSTSSSDSLNIVGKFANKRTSKINSKISKIHRSLRNETGNISEIIKSHA